MSLSATSPLEISNVNRIYGLIPASKAAIVLKHRLFPNIYLTNVVPILSSLAQLADFPIPHKNRRFIPLRLDDSEIKFQLKQFSYIDWRNRDEAEYQRLLATIFEDNEEPEPPEIHEEVDAKIEKYQILEGHQREVNSVAISPDGKFIVSGSDDKTVRIWDRESGQCLKTLEGHSSLVSAVTISADGKFIVSGSGDKTIRIWDTSDITEKLKDPPVEITKTDDQEYEFYTNAKVLLVGDSGVGKSGLAHRLINNEFVETISTDGVWSTQMKLEHETNTTDTEREIWLWDFAGQSDYRLIHQLFMDETALAVLVFNPQADNPFEGLGNGIVICSEPPRAHLIN